jgi:hypothetical protein
MNILSTVLLFVTSAYALPIHSNTNGYTPDASGFVLTYEEVAIREQLKLLKVYGGTISAILLLAALFSNTKLQQTYFVLCSMIVSLYLIIV